MTTSRRWGLVVCGAAAGVCLSPAWMAAHSGPPFPIVSNRVAGAYEISVWTDPDSTDDGSAAGRFWVTVRPAEGRGTVPAATRATVSVTAADRQLPAASARTEPTRDDVTQQFAALVLDHEGRFRVHVAIDGPLGTAAVDGDVDATYDLRPAPGLIVLYVMPFVLVGFLWLKLLLRRRRPP